MGDVRLQTTAREAHVLRALHELAGADQAPTISQLVKSTGIPEFQVKLSLRALHRKGMLREAGAHVVEVAGPSVIAFTVEGTPRPQGSKVGFETDDGVRLLESSGENLRAWRALVRDVAWLHRPPAPWTGPVRAVSFFYLRLPASPTSEYPIGRPDVDKLERAVFDALVDGQVLQDDAQIVDHQGTKRFGDDGEVRLEIVLTLLEPGPTQTAAAGTRGGTP